MHHPATLSSSSRANIPPEIPSTPDPSSPGYPRQPEYPGAPSPDEPGYPRQPEYPDAPSPIRRAIPPNPSTRPSERPDRTLQIPPSLSRTAVGNTSGYISSTTGSLK